MSRIHMHEQLHRGEASMARLAAFPVTICGAGSLGAGITESLARTGCGRLTVIDRDRVEEHNLSTQPYGRGDIGSKKATMLANQIYRAVGVKVDAVTRELEESNARKLLRGAELVIDTFDNSVARGVVTEVCRDRKIPCLHAGMASDYAEVIWNQVYTVPSDAGDDICDYPLARNLVTLTTALACETAIRFITGGERESRTLTFGDFAVKPYES
ncbi:MAG: ThiF family adenylyltransferase [Acidobacteriota bacterium]|nr:ThiF family adenylyltransferase [Acidobacteriota bacterium]